jgi:uncharacterized membrane protein YqjE
VTEPRTPTTEASTGELLVQASQDISQLIRDEMALAKAELAESGKKVGIGAGLFGLAGSLALYGLGALIATAILAISEGLEPWIAAGIVTIVLFVAAGIAALVGKGRISTAGDPPKGRVDSVKADLATAKHGTTGGNDDV